MEPEPAQLGPAAGQVTGSTLVLVPLALAIDDPFALPIPGPGAIAAVAGLAFLSTAFAYILYFSLSSPVPGRPIFCSLPSSPRCRQ